MINVVAQSLIRLRAESEMQALVTGASLLAADIEASNPTPSPSQTLEVYGHILKTLHAKLGNELDRLTGAK